MRTREPLLGMQGDADCGAISVVTTIAPCMQGEVLCDLGTDCTDCGPFKGYGYSPTW